MDHRPSVRTRLRRTVRICLSKKSPITNCVAIPGRPPSLYSGAISPSTNSQSILPASCTSSCLMLMIWSSRARNRSADPVVSCFFGRIAPSDAATESCFSIRGNRENEIASFHGLRHGNLAISSQQSRQKTTLAQWVRNSSRATPQFHLRAPEHLQGAGLVGHVFLRDLSLGEISVSLEPSTLPPPDCANNALFRSMWRHCDGWRYADRPLGAGGTQCELYVLWQS